MKLTKSSYEILEQGPGLDGIYKQIELAARTCYKSEDKITEDSTKKFVDALIKSGHTSCLEHGTVYLKLPWDIFAEHLDPVNPIEKTIYDHDWVKYCIDVEEDIVYITSNYRWIKENNLESFLQYLCEPTEYHAKRVSVKFSTDIGVTRELNRHRVNSVAEQSTRYNKIAA